MSQEEHFYAVFFLNVIILFMVIIACCAYSSIAPFIIYIIGVLAYFSIDLVYIKNKRAERLGLNDDEIDENGKKIKKPISASQQLFRIVLFGMLLYNFIPACYHALIYSYQVSEWFSEVIISILIMWTPVLVIPLILRFGFGKFSKKIALTFTIIWGILLFFANVFLSIYTKETITIWNIPLIVIPYYVLTDKPIFSCMKKIICIALCFIIIGVLVALFLPQIVLKG